MGHEMIFLRNPTVRPLTLAICRFHVGHGEVVLTCRLGYSCSFVNPRFVTRMTDRDRLEQPQRAEDLLMLPAVHET